MAEWERTFSLIQLGALTQLENIQKLKDTILSKFCTIIQDTPKNKENTLKQVEDVELIYIGALTHILNKINELNDETLTKIGSMAKIDNETLKKN